MLRFRSAAMVVLLASSALLRADEKLLDVSGGRRPNSTALEGESTFALVDNADLGGRALQVELAAEDSFGNKGVGPQNWTEFEALAFSVINPMSKPVTLTLTVRHAKTTNLQTRSDTELTFQPGKSNVRIGIDKLRNVNGSQPDLSTVVHWYFSGSEAATLLFSDIVLVGGAAPSPELTSEDIGQAIGGAVRLRGQYRITGKISPQGEVDLLLTPVGEPEVGDSSEIVPPRKRVAIDPERLAQLRAAELPAITRPVMFDTPEADAIVSAMQILPPDHAINQVVHDWPVHPNSEKIVASIGGEKPLRYNPDMAYILVPPNQRRVDVKIIEIPDESDPGPYPVPDNTPIEGWPVRYERDGNPLTLAEVQKRPAEYEDDRHAIIVDPTRGMLYEFFTFGRTREGWACDQASIFDLKSNELRPDGWTSADAAGLPIFPLVVRYDELERGVIEHALRMTVRRSQRAYVHPATHFASELRDENLPRMGERLRLRADFDTRGFSPPVRTILIALKKYGMLVADNGIEWAISVTPDGRIPSLHEELRRVTGSDFEVVVAP